MENRFNLLKADQTGNDIENQTGSRQGAEGLMYPMLPNDNSVKMPENYVKLAKVEYDFEPQEPNELLIRRGEFGKLFFINICF